MGTRLTLTARVREYIDETDTTNTHFTDSQIYSFLNQAIRFLGTDLEWSLQTAEATSVTDQAVYTLPENFISLVDVYFDGRDMPILERADLSQLDPEWQDAESGTPRYTYKSDVDKIGLWPKPNSDQASKTIQIQYIKIPADLAADVDIPDLHTAIQDCLPFYAAFICEKSLGNAKVAQANLDQYEYHKKKIESKVQNYSGETRRFVWPRNIY
jgi:hypothetical protein